MRPKRYLVYAVGTYIAVMAALAYPDVTVVLAWVVLLGGIAWWVWPVVSKKIATDWKSVEDVPRQIRLLHNYRERNST